MAKYSNGLEDNIDLTGPAISVLEGRYLKTNPKTGKKETMHDLCTRVAETIAQADKNYSASREGVAATAREFFAEMAAGKFYPNSPTLMNAGTGNGLNYSACFVLPIEDSIDGIFEAAKRGAIVHKAGGGTGYDFSNIRPKNDPVRSTKGVASGPVSFMYIFDVYTRAVKQGGTRRGANMGILRVDHPDIIEFINSKTELDEDGMSIINSFKGSAYLQRKLKERLREKYQLSNLNISVAATEKFMDAVLKDGDYELIHPGTKQAIGTLNAREVFNKITDNAWETGDPGIVFMDRMDAFNPTPALGHITATNPCGEQPLLSNESCNLGSINVAKFVRRGRIDYRNLGKTVDIAVHFLDNVIDTNNYAIFDIEKMTKTNRKIGLGVMGVADLFSKLNVRYGSQESLEVSRKLMGFIQSRAEKASAKLAETRGPFPAWEDSIYNKGSKHFKGRHIKLRNATRTTIAPTGTIGIIAGSSQGIEPPFSIVGRRATGQFKFAEISREFVRMTKERGIYSEELLQKISDAGGSLADIKDIPDDIKKIFPIANELSLEAHIGVQAAFQEYTNNAVSKTINFSNSATAEDIRRAYLLAHSLGCKGITIYRDGSKGTQVLTSGKSGRRERILEEMIKEKVTAPRPEIVEGPTEAVSSAHGKVFVTLNFDENGDPYEVFINVGKSGSVMNAASEALGRILSQQAKGQFPLEHTISQLEGVGGRRSITERSMADAIARGMKTGYDKYHGKRGAKKDEQKESIETHTGNNCPKCDSPLIMEEGCEKCHNCGYSTC